MRWKDGRDEPIVDPQLPIVDAHHHLYDKPGMRYMPGEFVEDMKAGHRIVASVFIEASSFHRRSGPEALRPLGEVEFVNGVGAQYASGQYGAVRPCAAIVGYADMRTGDAIGWYLDRACTAAPDRFRGVRQITMDHPSDAPYRYFLSGRPAQGLYEHPKFKEAFRQLSQRGLTYDATGFHLQLPAIGDLADAFPDTPIVLNHMTVAMGLDMSQDERAELFRDWREKLAKVAKRPNAICKVGGLGMPVWGFGFDERPAPISYRDLAESWRPFVETAIELFGPGRCMMESNYPPDARSCGYVPIWNALKHIVSGASPDEKADLFHATAARVYRIDLTDVMEQAGAAA